VCLPPPGLHHVGLFWPAWPGLAVDEGALLQEGMRRLVSSVKLGWSSNIEKLRSPQGCSYCCVLCELHVTAMVAVGSLLWSDWPGVDIGTAGSEGHGWPTAACRSPLTAVVPALARVPCAGRAMCTARLDYYTAVVAALVAEQVKLVSGSGLHCNPAHRSFGVVDAQGSHSTPERGNPSQPACCLFSLHAVLHHMAAPFFPRGYYQQ